MAEIRTWEDFIAACSECRACALSETRTRVAVWRGSVQAPVLMIGEGPGAEEDRQGRPFVGAAGRLLDLGLEALGLSDSLIHIANIVKCRPPGNRVPTEEEARACRPLLAAQFRFVRPKIIVLLGATAFHCFTGSTAGITKVRGTWIEKNGYQILPTLHPAYILRNSRERVHLWEDLAMVRAKLEDLGLAPPLDGQADSVHVNGQGKCHP